MHDDANILAAGRFLFHGRQGPCRPRLDRPASNLAASHVYLFSGGADAVVDPATIELAERVYQTLGVPKSQIVFHDKDYKAGHSWVTNNCCQSCADNKNPYIDNCNYDQAGDILHTIYGPLQPPAIPPTGRIVPSHQTEFVPQSG